MIDKQAKKEMLETSFRVATNNIKYRKLTLTQKVKYLCDNNFKPLKQEIKETIKTVKDLPCSWFSRFCTIYSKK